MRRIVPDDGVQIKSYITTMWDVNSLVFAKSNHKAKYITWKAINDAGYNIEFLEINKIKCRRAKRFDDMAHESTKCLSLDFMEECLLRESPTPKAGEVDE